MGIWKLVLAVSGVALLAAPLQAFERPGSRSDEVDLFGQGDEDGSMTAFVVSRLAAERSPAWDPEAEEPPLPVSRAVTLAKELFLSAHPRYDGAKVNGIDLMRVGSFEVRDRWFYVISFSAVIDGQTMFGNRDAVVLLMDGTAAEARPGKR